MPFQPIKPKKVSSQIAEQIRSSILAGEFAPGDKLPPERELAELFGVSRPSVREALNMLASSGLVESYQGGGTVVKSLVELSAGNPLSELIKGEQARALDVIEVRKCMEGWTSYYVEDSFRREQAAREHRERAGAGGEAVVEDAGEVAGLRSVLPHREREADPFGSPGDDRNGEADREQAGREQPAQIVVDAADQADPAADRGDLCDQRKQQLGAALPGEHRDRCRHRREATGGDPDAPSKRQRAESEQHEHPEQVGRALGEHRGDHPARRAAPQLAHQPGLAQLARLAGGHREEEPDQEDREAFSPRERHVQPVEIDLPADETERVVDEREPENRRQQGEIELGEAGGDFPGVGEQCQADTGEDPQERRDQQPTAEMLEAAPGLFHLRPAGRGGRGGRRREGRCRLLGFGLNRPAQAAFRTAGATSGYCSNRRIHWLFFVYSAVRFLPIVGYQM